MEKREAIPDDIKRPKKINWTKYAKCYECGVARGLPCRDDDDEIAWNPCEDRTIRRDTPEVISLKEEIEKLNEKLEEAKRKLKDENSKKPRGKWTSCKFCKKRIKTLKTGNLYFCDEHCKKEFAKQGELFK